jgi:uncharacterized membrane protein YbhN (UPF0104 family)
MMKLLSWTGATVGGAVGWWALSRLGLFGAFMGSIVGTALGLYVGRRLALHWGG